LRVQQLTETFKEQQIATSGNSNHETCDLWENFSLKTVSLPLNATLTQSLLGQ